MSGKPTRRAFFGSAGAALAAPFAATAAFAGERKGRAYVLGNLPALDDANAIRVLQQRYAQLAGAARRDALAGLFVESARSSVDERVRSIVVDGDDSIEILRDGTATAIVPCIVTMATPIENCGTLVEMARLQGDGFVASRARRVLRGSFVKRGGVWRIVRMEIEA